MENKKETLSDKFIKNKDMWNCMSDEQYNIIGESNFWLNEDDVKEFIKDLKDNVKNITDGIERDNIKTGHILDRIDELAGDKLI